MSAGCGSPPPPKIVTASGNVASLRMFVKAAAEGPGQNLKSVFEAELARAGFSIVDGEVEAFDITVDLRITTRQEAGFIQVRVNGRVQKTTIATVTLRLLADGVTLESARAEYEVGEQMDPKDLRRLVAKVTNSSSLTGQARKVEGQKKEQFAEAKRTAQAEKDKVAAALAKKKAAADALIKKAEDEEMAAWNQVVASECSEPRGIGSCNDIKVFLGKYPTGRHAGEAKKALETGSPKINTLIDEGDWNKSQSDACKDPKLSTDCSGVQTYLDEHPTGAHAAEAKTSLSESQAKRVRLAKTEKLVAERKAKREQALAERAAKKAEYDACKEGCEGPCINWRTGGVRGPCYQLCVARQCRRR